MIKRGVHRVIRGGSYRSDWILRTTYHFGGVPERRYGDIGFRLVVRRKP